MSLSPDEIIAFELHSVHFDPHHPLPLYHQVYTFLHNLIVSEKLKPGDLLPSEAELTETFKVGRQTVRKALANLVNDQMLERYAGKGTFVSSMNIQKSFYLDRSFSQQMTDMGIESHSRVLRMEPGTIGESAHPQLQKKWGAPCLYLDRIRYGNNTPVGVQYSTVITEQCPNLVQYDFNVESLYHVLSVEYQLKITEIYHVVTAILADETLSGFLHISPGDPLLVEKSVTFLSDGDPIEATLSYYPPDKHEYSIRFHYRSNEKYSN